MDGWCISTKLLLLTILLVLLVLAMLLVCTFVVIFVRTFVNWGLCRRHCGAASHFLDLTLFTLLINRRRRRSKGLSFIYFWFIHKKTYVLVYNKENWPCNSPHPLSPILCNKVCYFFNYITWENWNNYYC